MEAEVDRIIASRIENMKSIRKKLNKISDTVCKRNASLDNLISLSRHFNEYDWLVTRDNPKEYYPIEEIMKYIGCSKRVAYDYARTLEALDLCSDLFNEIVLFLKAVHTKRQLSKGKEQ